MKSTNRYPHLTTILLFLVGFTSPTVRGQNPSEDRPRVMAGPVPSPVNGHVYYLLERSNWSAAERVAVALGGHLVTVNDDEECDWIYDTFSFFGGQARPLWCGLTDEGSEGEFRWVSGEAVHFENWAEGEPNRSVEFAPVENHVFLYPTQSPRERRWRDASDDSFERYLPSALWATVEEAWIGAQGLVEVAPKVRQVVAPRISVTHGRLMLSWDRLVGSEYQIQSALELGGPWVNVGERTLGDSGPVELQNPAARLGHAFYRVLVVR